MALVTPRSALQCAVLLLSLGAFLVSSQTPGPFRYGHATYYGTDDWSIHQGSCAYGYLYQDEPLGWDVAALTDFDPEYATSCGLCYEVFCNPGNVLDGYGVSAGRWTVCFDTAASVVVRITDTCPCIYPTNAASNKRWCCQSDAAPHLDVSIWAFEKLALSKWGFIGIKFRQVPCNYQPAKKAALVPSPSPGTPPPAGGVRVVRDWPEYWPQGATSAQLLANGVMSNGWKDASYSASISFPGWVAGLRGTSSYCATLAPHGALSLFASASNGGLTGRISMAFWVYIGQSQSHVTPPATIVVGGPAGDCMPLMLDSIKPTGFAPTCQYCTDQWWRYNVPLSALAGQGINSILSNNQFFQGCGGNTAAQLNYIDLRNFNSGSMSVCLSHVLLK